MGRHDRPEEAAPPEIFYGEDEARKYTENSRMVAIQAQLTERALELLALPDDGEPKLLLDLGCGSGLSGEQLTERGHIWVVRLLLLLPAGAAACVLCCARMCCCTQLHWSRDAGSAMHTLQTRRCLPPARLPSMPTAPAPSPSCTGHGH